MSAAQLKLFHQTLLWPLRLVIPKKQDNITEAAMTALTKEPYWKTTTLSKYADPTTRYAEQVYFHPFIRQFLYGDANSEPMVEVCERTDIKTVKVTLKSNKTFTLNVKRIQLYLFEVGIAILAVEVSSQQLENIQDVEDFLDQFRRAYPPYWDEWGAGHSPKSVEFFSENDQSVVTSNFDNVDFFQKDVIEDKNFPVATHWAYLLQPWMRYQKNDIDSDKIRYQQIEDERIPYMAHLAFDNPRLLTKGDFIRLALADDAGDSNSFPYAEPFLKDFTERYCYDRFWEEKENSWLNTRYTCCGYAFTTIGEYYMDVSKKPNDPEPGFFINEKVGGLSHFRHHYFIMGVIVHFHKAALLMLWDKLAQAVAKFTKNEKSRRQFKKEVHDILEELLHFSHRYWFTEVSNQVQPKELFDWWSNHLETRILFERVMKEAQDAHQFLEMEEQKRQTDTSVRLTTVATVALAVGLALGFFGGNPDMLAKWTGLSDLDLASLPNWGWLLISIGISSILMMVMIFFSTPLARLLEWIAGFWQK